MSAGTEAVARMLARWSAARLVLAEVEAAEHPDIVDEFGRVWTWRGNDTYGHDSTFAIPRSWVAESNLPPETLAQNWNYHRLCAVCTQNWSAAALAQHAQNAVDIADYDRLGWNAYAKSRRG